MMDTKQEENEDLTTHTKRFKQANNTFKESVGDNWMSKFVEHTAEHTATGDANEQAELKKSGPEKFAAFVHMKNSETRKCGRSLSNLKEQCALGTINVPRRCEKQMMH